MAIKGGDDFSEDELYDRFPAGADQGYGPEQGYAVKRRLNDRSLFTEEALADPVIAEFVDLPYHVSYLQTKSSTREAEWLLHKPDRVLAGEVPGFDIRPGPTDRPAHITTLLVNHERTMARWKQTTLLLEDENGDTTQIVYKRGEEQG